MVPCLIGYCIPQQVEESLARSRCLKGFQKDTGRDKWRDGTGDWKEEWMDGWTAKCLITGWVDRKPAALLKVLQGSRGWSLGKFQWY